MPSGYESTGRFLTIAQWIDGAENPVQPQTVWRVLHGWMVKLEAALAGRQPANCAEVENMLKLSEARYQAVVESQSDLICRSLPDGTLTFVNEACCRYFGHAYDEMLATSIIPMIPPEEQDRIAAQLNRCNADQPMVSYEHRVIRADGLVRWIQWTTQAILDENNALIELQSVGRDITDQRQTEKNLQDSEERYRRIVQTTSEGIWLLDAAHCTTFIIEASMLIRTLPMN